MSAPLAGQIVFAGGVAAPLQAAPLPCTAFTIKAPLSNQAACFIGPASVTTGNGYQLDPGDTFEYERSVQNGQPIYQLYPSDFFAVGTTGDKVTWLASP